jgi:hypothetical protein
MSKKSKEKDQSRREYAATHAQEVSAAIVSALYTPKEALAISPSNRTWLEVIRNVAARLGKVSFRKILEIQEADDHKNFKLSDMDGANVKIALQQENPNISTYPSLEARHFSSI